LADEFVNLFSINNTKQDEKLYIVVHLTPSFCIGVKYVGPPC